MLKTLHLELTSRCILACPACPRTIFTKKFNRPFPKFDLDLDDLENFLNCNTGKDIDHFQLEGNHGDLIYYPHLFEFIARWRTTKKFTFITNGSNRDTVWWYEFSKLLTKDDKVIFSVDGFNDTNHLYRVNSNWESIINAIKIVANSDAHTVWRTIIFKTNEHQIDTIKEFAYSLGVDEYATELTHRFGDDDKFKPKRFIDIANNLKPLITAGCRDNKLLYISADGYIYPCCYIVTYNTLHSTEFWKNKEVYSIKNKSFYEFLNQQHIEKFINRIEDNYDSAYKVCQTNCNANTQEIKLYTILEK